jgi:hypothetical protein
MFHLLKRKNSKRNSKINEILLGNSVPIFLSISSNFNLNTPGLSSNLFKRVDTGPGLYSIHCLNNNTFYIGPIFFLLS